MSFNLIAESTKKVDWKAVHNSISKQKIEGIEFFPIVEEEQDLIYALGISIPSNSIKTSSVESVKEMIDELIKQNFIIYELYNGDQINSDNFEKIVNLIFN